MSGLRRRDALRLLHRGVALAQVRYARSVEAGQRGSGRGGDDAVGVVHPLFDLLLTLPGVAENVMSYLDPRYCCVKDQINVLACWKKLGGNVDDLRRGHGDDVSKWTGVWVEGGRVRCVDWGEKGLEGDFPEEFGRLTGLVELR